YSIEPVEQELQPFAHRREERELRLAVDAFKCGERQAQAGALPERCAQRCEGGRQLLSERIDLLRAPCDRGRVWGFRREALRALTLDFLLTCARLVGLELAQHYSKSFLMSEPAIHLPRVHPV